MLYITGSPAEVPERQFFSGLLVKEFELLHDGEMLAVYELTPYDLHQPLAELPRGRGI